MNDSVECVLGRSGVLARKARLQRALGRHVHQGPAGLAQGIATGRTRSADQGLCAARGQMGEFHGNLNFLDDWVE